MLVSFFTYFTHYFIHYVIFFYVFSIIILFLVTVTEGKKGLVQCYSLVLNRITITLLITQYIKITHFWKMSATEAATKESRRETGDVSGRKCAPVHCTMCV